METENTAKAGGDAQSKDVDDTPEQETGGEAEGTNESERAGGDAESKGVY
jgi:hypothetical protein